MCTAGLLFRRQTRGQRVRTCVIHRHGDLFTSDAPAYGHGVNCAGVMGAGIAKQFRNRFPGMVTPYRQLTETGQLRPGEVYAYTPHPSFERPRVIYNMASQDLPGKHARLDWLTSAGTITADDAVRRSFDRVAIPLIGCGIGGLDWSAVEPVLTAMENPHGIDFQWEVWSL